MKPPERIVTAELTRFRFLRYLYGLITILASSPGQIRASCSNRVQDHPEHGDSYAPPENRRSFQLEGTSSLTPGFWPLLSKPPRTPLTKASFCHAITRRSVRSQNHSMELFGCRRESQLSVSGQRAQCQIHFGHKPRSNLSN